MAKDKEIHLSKTYVHSGKFYGPGKVMVPPEVHVDLVQREKESRPVGNDKPRTNLKPDAELPKAIEVEDAEDEDAEDVEEESEESDEEEESDDDSDDDSEDEEDVDYSTMSKSALVVEAKKKGLETQNLTRSELIEALEK